MGATLGATEETMRDAIRLCGDVLRSGYDYDAVDSVAGACLYLACERQDEPISLPDVADQARKSQKNIQHLGAKLMGELGFQLTPAEPDPYLEEGADQFGFTDSQLEDCWAILEAGREQNLHSGLAPTTVAGAILYGVARKHRLGITQQEISDFANKTEVSIRNSYKKFLALDDEVPVDVLPPQTIEQALDQLQASFPSHPDSTIETTRELVEAADLPPSVSTAGVVGGAYLVSLRGTETSTTPTLVASALGVQAPTVRTHADHFHDES